MPILEGLHYISHCFISDHSHVSHSYFSHEESHDHAGLDMIDNTDEDNEGSHNSTTSKEANKKYQIGSLEMIPRDFVELAIRSLRSKDNLWSSLARDIYTPPPQV